MEYGAGSLTAEELTEAFATLFNQTGGWNQVQERLPPGETVEAADQLPLTIKDGEGGFDPATATIIVAGIVAVSPVVQKIVMDLWTEVWLPRLKANKGDDALGDSKEP